MTEVQPYFTQIIGHNSVNIHRIPTKLGTEICLNPLGTSIIHVRPNIASRESPTLYMYVQVNRQ